MSLLVTKYLNLSPDEVERYLEQRDFDASIQPAAIIGNLYSGSLFLSLASLLDRRYRRHGDRIVGERLMLLSYGSGNTAVVLAGQVAPRAPEVIGRWDMASAIDHVQEARPDDYDQWVSGDGYDTRASRVTRYRIPRDSFYLQQVREDGYRVYALQR